MRSHRRLPGGAVALMTVAALAASLVAPTAAPSAGAAIKVRGPFHLAQGVLLWRIRYPAPNEVRVLRIDPTRASIDVYPAAPTFGSITPMSQQGVANGAVAAVNGDFGTFDGEPTHASLIDAALRTSGRIPGAAFSVNGNGRRAWAQWANGSIAATAPTDTFAVARLNAGAARGGEVAAFTKAGGTKEQPVNGMCAAELEPTSGYRWSDKRRSGIARTYQVTQQPDPCPYKRLAFSATSSPGTVILQAKKVCWCAHYIIALKPGDTVELSWSTLGRHGTTDQMGGFPQLIKDGRNVAPGPRTSGSYFWDRNPRTGVGITAGCTDVDTATKCYVYMITVDGRQPGWSVGMTLPNFAKVFLRQRPPATWAINLDGGGGTEMWVSKRRPKPYCQMLTPAGGCTVDRPSGDRERPAITSLQVLDAPDPGEPGLRTASIAASAMTPLTVSAPVNEIAQDPGSTGGMLDAIARGGLGPLPNDPTLQAMLTTYRRALASGLVTRLARG